MDRAAAMLVARRRRRRDARRHLPADAARDGRRGAGARPAPGRLHADLLRATRRRPWPAGCAPSRRRTSSRRTGSCGAARSIPLKRTADAALAEAPAVRRVLVVRRLAEGSAGDDVPMDPRRDRWWHEALAATSPDATVRPGRRHRPRNAVHGDLHVGHHRRPEGHRPRARRLPDQGRAGPRAHVRPAARRLPVLVHGPRLDDGPVGDRRGAAQRGAARGLRRRAGLPGARPHLVDRRAPPRDAPRRQPDARAGADRPRRGARARARPLLAARPRLHRRALEPRSVAWYFRVAGDGAAADRELLGRHGDRRRHRRLLAGPAHPAHVVQRAVPRDGRGRRRPDGRIAARRRRRARDPDAVAGDDPRLLGRRRRSATSRRTGGACPGLWIHGDWALVDDEGFWYLLGRSDDTLKVAGKRVGPAEVEAAAVAHPPVVEAAAIGVPDALKGESIVVLAILRPGVGRRGRAVSAEISDLVVRDLGQDVPAGCGRAGARPAADAERQDHAARRAGRVPARRARRPVGAREPGRGGGDRGGRRRLAARRRRARGPRRRMPDSVRAARPRRRAPARAARALRRWTGPYPAAVEPRATRQAWAAGRPALRPAGRRRRALWTAVWRGAAEAWPCATAG